MMAPEECGHEACACVVTDEAEFCSAHCETAAQASEEPETCECGHGDCSG